MMSPEHKPTSRELYPIAATIIYITFGVLAGLGALNLFAWIVAGLMGWMPLYMHAVYALCSLVGALIVYRLVGK